MEILITNDDGVFSPGLEAAAKAALEFGNITVIAPSRQQTATGRSLAGNREQGFTSTELNLGGKKIKAFHIDCTPALALKLGFTTVFRNRKPDLVISGINYGENIGSDVTISGTLGAAFEAASIGIPSIAVSLQTPIEYHLEYGNMEWEHAGYFLKLFIRKFIEKRGFEGFEILKIDVPENADEKTGWLLTKLTDRPYYRNIIKEGTEESKLNEMKLEVDNGSNHMKGTDAYTVAVEKMVSVTPIKTDFTAYSCEKYFY